MYRIIVGGNFMAAIRPSSDLRNKYNEISDYCNQYNEPVFITKNGNNRPADEVFSEIERKFGFDGV